MDNTVSIGFFLDTRRKLKKSAGEYGVKADLRYMGRRWQFATPFAMTQAEWDNLENKKIRSDSLKEKKLQLEAYRVKAQNIIDTLHPFTIEKFKALLLGKGEFAKPENRDVYRLFMRVEERFELKNKPRTADSYRSARRSLMKFRSKLYLEDVTPEFLQKYENYMVERKRSLTTVGIHLRSLRAIINEAIEEGLMRHEDYPFSRRKYTIPQPRQTKNFLPPEQIKSILSYCPETIEEQAAKDIWVFSYFCGGMNINDICRLKRENIEGDTLSFYRNKTKDTSGRNSLPIRILLQPEVFEILNRQKALTGYLFPVLKPNLGVKRESALIQQFTKTTNKYLKSIGAKLHIPKLTTQTARHSFATTLMNNGVPLAFISKSMGHTTTKTTEIYFGSFSESEAAKYGEMLKALA